MSVTIATRKAADRTGPALVDDDHERVLIRQDRESGMRLIVAVHSTVLGPALGGLRLRRYPGGLREALDEERLGIPPTPLRDVQAEARRRSVAREHARRSA